MTAGAESAPAPGEYDVMAARRVAERRARSGVDDFRGEYVLEESDARCSRERSAATSRLVPSRVGTEITGLPTYLVVVGGNLIKLAANRPNLALHQARAFGITRHESFSG
jgi:hypothetical protein